MPQYVFGLSWCFQPAIRPDRGSHALTQRDRKGGGHFDRFKCWTVMDTNAANQHIARSLPLKSLIISNGTELNARLLKFLRSTARTIRGAH